jgi:hypothetical protein
MSVLLCGPEYTVGPPGLDGVILDRRSCPEGPDGGSNLDATNRSRSS